MSAEEGAAIPVNYLTAWQLIVVMAATQIAKHIGARVIGTASATKHGELRALGVGHLIDDFEACARQITDGRGVELDPLYVDVIIRRYDAASGESVVLIETGERYADLAESRVGGSCERKAGEGGRKLTNEDEPIYDARSIERLAAAETRNRLFVPLQATVSGRRALTTASRI
jgi:hypothetical protein